MAEPTYNINIKTTGAQVATQAFATITKEASKTTGAIGKLDVAFKTSGATTTKLLVGYLAVSQALRDIAAVGGRAIRGLHELAKESGEAARIVSDLNAALRSQGNFSAEASKGIQDYAARLQQLAGADADALVSGMAKIEGATGVNTEMLKDAGKAAFQVSVLYKKDLNSSIELITKALNGKTTSLSRMGIELKKGASQAEILDAVIKRTAAGMEMAESRVNTYEGATAKLALTWGDFRKKLGSFITENPAVVYAINSISTAIGTLSGGMGYSATVGDMLANAMLSVADGVLAAAQGMQNAMPVLQQFGDVMAFIYKVNASQAAILSGRGTVFGAGNITQDLADIWNGTSGGTGSSNMGPINPDTDPMGAARFQLQRARGNIANGGLNVPELGEGMSQTDYADMLAGSPDALRVKPKAGPKEKLMPEFQFQQGHRWPGGYFESSVPAGASAWQRGVARQRGRGIFAWRARGRADAEQTRMEQVIGGLSPMQNMAGTVNGLSPMVSAPWMGKAAISRWTEEQQERGITSGMRLNKAFGADGLAAMASADDPMQAGLGIAGGALGGPLGALLGGGIGRTLKGLFGGGKSKAVVQPVHDEKTYKAVLRMVDLQSLVLNVSKQGLLRGTGGGMDAANAGVFKQALGAAFG